MYRIGQRARLTTGRGYLLTVVDFDLRIAVVCVAWYTQNGYNEAWLPASILRPCTARAR